MKRKTRKDDGPLQWMQQWFKRWMKTDEDFRTANLMEALEGHDLPPVGPDEEPYIWIWRGVPTSSRQRRKALKLLISEIEVILTARPPQCPVWRFDDDALYNLFSLCVCLKSFVLLSPIQQLRNHIKPIVRSATRRTPLRAHERRRDFKRQEVITALQDARKVSFLNMVFQDCGLACHNECQKILASATADFSEYAVLTRARQTLNEPALAILAAQNAIPFGTNCAPD